MTELCTSSQHMSRMSQYDWSEHIEAELSSKLNNTGFSVIINLIYRQLIVPRQYAQPINFADILTWTMPLNRYSGATLWHSVKLYIFHDIMSALHINQSSVRYEGIIYN